MPQDKKRKLIEQLQGSTIERKLSIDSKADAIDKEGRKISFIAISDDNAGFRFSWDRGTYIEKLDVNGAKYERLRIFLKDHENRTDSAIGRIENKRVEDNKFKLDVVFGTDEVSDGTFRKYEEGILTDCSIRYIIEKVLVEERVGEPDIVNVTEFDIFECSAVAVGFDKGATVGRNLNLNEGDNLMDEELKKELASLRSAVDGLTAEQQKRKKELEDIEKDAQRALTTSVQDEKTRGVEILNLAAAGHLTLERASEFVSKGTSIDEVRKAVIDEKSRSSHTVVVGGVPDAANMMRDVENSILLRCGVKIPDVKASENYFRGATLTDMARHIVGINSMDRVDIAQRAMSNDQFTLLLGNIANRVMVSNFEEQEGTYNLWTTNVDLPNFKLQTDVSVKNPNGRLSKLKEKGELESLELDESGEAWKLESYGNKFVFTRQMLINDDLGAFTNIIATFGQMAKRTSNGLVYDLLQAKGDFANYKMSDNKALFHSDHKNMGTAAGLSSASLSDARVLMRRQMDGKTALNINPKYLIVSPENETIAKQLLTSESDLSGNNSGVTNIHKNSLDLIVESELSANPWFLAAARKTIKTGTLAGTGGQPIVQEKMKSAGGVEFECLYDFGVMIEDHRSLYRNLGA